MADDSIKVSEEELLELLKKLTILAHILLENHGMNRCDKEPHDFAADAILKFKSGTRKWYKPDEVTLFRFLSYIVRSDINHYYNSSENKTLHRQSPEDIERHMSDSINRDTSGHTNHSSICQDPAEKVINQETINETLKSIEIIDNKTKYPVSDVGKRMGLGYMDKEIARELGIDPNVVKETKKKIRREINKNLPGSGD